jgi:hypothetical protein
MVSLNELNTVVITITTLSGERVSAPLVKWVQALILHRSPEDLTKLLRLVEPNLVTVVPATDVRPPSPADPREFLRGGH